MNLHPEFPTVLHHEAAEVVQDVRQLEMLDVIHLKIQALNHFVVKIL